MYRRWHRAERDDRYTSMTNVYYEPGKPKLTVYVDLDRMYTMMPPSSKVSVEREIDTCAVQAVLTIYRSILFGQRREQLALMAGVVIALGAVALAVFAIWQYNHTI